MVRTYIVPGQENTIPAGYSELRGLLKAVHSLQAALKFGAMKFFYNTFHLRSFVVLLLPFKVEAIWKSMHDRDLKPSNSEDEGLGSSEASRTFTELVVVWCWQDSLESTEFWFDEHNLRIKN